ncbi:MAG: adenosine deaminase [Clostridia bacterium]|nr:adenosine deaminase [Clostridia bacterium]
MSRFGQFYLDKEKDIVVELDLRAGTMNYILRTPHHHTGNLITNLARMCSLPLSEDENGLKIIEGTVPCYIDGYNQTLYVFRLGGTKVANIYPDGRIEMKGSIPAISKTLMSQTKDYRLSIAKTIVKTYIRSECKFETDLHTHMNGNLMPEILIAMGIRHQIRYPLYYIKKLELRCTPEQLQALRKQRSHVSMDFADSLLTGKYLDRKIDDNTFINFADLILGNLPDAGYNIDRIATSLSVPKDGQAVFANLERTYLYRYIFTKGIPDEDTFPLDQYEKIPNETVLNALRQMLMDREHPIYCENTVFEDKLLWIARQYAAKGIKYAEITDTALTKPSESIRVLSQAHRVMPAVTAETGVLIRFLAGIRRIPLTIVKDQRTPNDYLSDNLRVIRAIAPDPYVAGADIIGEEINDIMELRQVIGQLVKLTAVEPDFVIRIHAGESDSLRDNVANSLKCVREALEPGQPMPHLRIGHGLYTCNLKSPKGERLLRELKESGAVLEFQITSNVRLNNLSNLEHHPLKTYLNAGVRCVQGTDGGALYGTDSIDEELSLEKLLELSFDELKLMRETDALVCRNGKAAFTRKQTAMHTDGKTVAQWLESRMTASDQPYDTLVQRDQRQEASAVLADRLGTLPAEPLPIIIAGGSFNNSTHYTAMTEQGKALIDSLLASCDPERVVFVIGHRLTGYEAYLVKENRGRIPVHAIVPTMLTQAETSRLMNSNVTVSLSIESSGLGLYKSFAYEIFKHRPSILLAFDGNAAAANLIQEAKNGRYKCRIFVNRRSRDLLRKAQTLQGYVHFLEEEDLLKSYLPLQKPPR